MTSPDRFARVKEHLLAALELPQGGRAVYLDALPASDADLRAEIEGLLRESDTGGGFELVGLTGVGALGDGGPVIRFHRARRSAATASSACSARAAWAPSTRPSRSPAPHRRPQGHPPRPRLAPTLLRRFEHEAEILGRLQHPGIAQIFEAGAADDGAGHSPIFAMELVRGRPLTELRPRPSLDPRRASS